MARTALLGAFCLAFGFTAARVQAQRVTLRDCDQPCPISVQQIVRLGNPSGGPGFIGRPASIVRMADGSFLVADRQDQDRIKHYSAQGTYIGHVGRRGSGPGEFQVVEHLRVFSGDSVEVYDFGLLRFTIFNPRLEHIRTLPSAPIPAWQLVTLRDGTRVAAGLVFGAGKSGLPLHTMSPEGGHLRWFGADPPIAELAPHYHTMRRLAIASDTSVWSAHFTEYRIEEWSQSGRLLRTLQRPTSWFRPHNQVGYRGERDAPNPAIFAVHTDSQGIIWTLLVVPDRRWREGVGMRRNVYGRQTRGIIDFDRFYDTLIEAIDPAGARVVGSVRLDGVAWGFTSDGLIYGFDESGLEPVVPIWRLVLPGR